MSKRIRAKAGRAFWAQMQRSPRHQRYSSKRMEISAESMRMPLNIFQAALAAGEALNASVQVVPDSKGHAVTPEPQGSAEHSVSIQQQIDEENAKGSSGGAQ